MKKAFSALPSLQLSAGVYSSVAVKSQSEPRSMLGSHQPAGVGDQGEVWFWDFQIHKIQAASGPWSWGWDRVIQPRPVRCLLLA